MKALGYVRVSKVGKRDGESFISPGEQRRAIESFAARESFKLVDVLDELDASGGSDRRPKWNEAIRRVESGEVSAIIVFNYSRFSRSLIHAKLAIERCEAVGGKVLSASEGSDGLSRDLMFLVAEHVRKQTRDSFAASTRNAVERGIHVSGSLPFGYARDEDKRLVAAETADVVRELFTRRATGESWADLTRWLATIDHRFSSEGVKRIVANRVYLGEARYGSNTNAAAHEPIVSVDLFERAQAAKTTSLRSPRTGAVIGKVFTQGLAVCGTCGQKLQPQTKRLKTGRVYINMLCPNHHCAGKGCLGAHYLDAEVESVVLGRLSVALRTTRAPRTASALSRAREGLRRAEEARDAFLDNTEALVHIGKERWNDQLAKLAERVDTARASVAATADAEDVSGWYDQPTRFFEQWMAADNLGKRVLLQRVLERVEVLPVYGKRGVPPSERVVVTFKQARLAIAV